MLNKRFFISFAAVAIVLVIALLSIRDTKPNKIIKQVAVYECMEITSSFEKIKSHLESHSQYVDKFVFLECGEDQEGNAKDLVYPDFKSELSAYADKIIYVLAPSLPKASQMSAKEFYYKNQYLKAFDECKKDDIIIFSNVNSHLTPDRLYQAIVALEQHPEEILLLKGKNRELDMKLTTYAHVKQALPATIEKSTKFKAEIFNWKSLFFPIKEPSKCI